MLLTIGLYYRRKGCKLYIMQHVFILDYTRRARWPFRAFCVDGLPQITSHCCNSIKLAEIGNRTDQKKRDTRTHGRTHGQTHGRTNIKFWGPSTQKALKGKNYLFLFANGFQPFNRYYACFTEFSSHDVNGFPKRSSEKT